MKRVYLLAIALSLASCASLQVKWPESCAPNKTGKIICSCKQVKYLREDRPGVPPPAFRQFILCDGVKLPVESDSAE